MTPDAPPLHLGGNVAAPRADQPRRPGRDRRRRRHRRATRSGCRTRPSSARSPASRCPTARAASTCTSRPSGCTSTATRSPSASASRPRRCGSTLGGVGGAFGGREDLSMQIHACMLALRTGRPVKMVYNREESFFGHVHRHPARMRYEHGATRDGRLVYVRARIVLDGGAYASQLDRGVLERGLLRRRAVRGAERAHRRVRRLHEQPAVRGDARLRRGPGRVRPRGADGQARRRARAWTRSSCGSRNAMAPGDAMPTGQVVPEPAPVAELLERRARHAAAAAAATARATSASCPAASPTRPTARASRRGVGYAVGFKNVGFSEGFDDYSTARVRLALDADGEPLVEVHTAAAEVGQGVHHRPGADRAHRAGDRARRGARTPTRGSARPARPRRRARPT